MKNRVFEKILEQVKPESELEIRKVEALEQLVEQGKEIISILQGIWGDMPGGIDE